MGRHSRSVSKTKLALAIAASACSEGLGIALISAGNHLSAQDLYYSVAPWACWGTLFLLLPLLVLAARVIAALGRALAAERRRYQAWKASLTPEQRAAVELAELAALGAAAYAGWRRTRDTDARLTESVMGRAPLNNVQAGQMATSARLMARSQAAAQQPWPTSQPQQPGLQPRIWQPPGQES